MNRVRSIGVVALLLALGCGSSGPNGGEEPLPDAANVPVVDAGPVTLPTWQLENIQPDSPQFGQVHGLDTFASQVIVVVLVQGF